MMFLVRIVGWLLVAIGGFTDPTDVGQSLMLLGVVLVLLNLMITKQDRGVR